MIDRWVDIYVIMWLFRKDCLMRFGVYIVKILLILLLLFLYSERIIWYIDYLYYATSDFKGDIGRRASLNMM